MARTVISRFEGTEQCVRKLEEIKRRTLNKGLKPGLIAGAELIRKDAAARAPRDRGRLARGMLAEWEPRANRARVGPHKDQYYGYFQELGTSRNAANPFLRPALDANAPAVFSLIAASLKETIEAN